MSTASAPTSRRRNCRGGWHAGTGPPAGGPGTIAAWPRPTASRSTSVSRRSGPSSPGSVITFDPDRLAQRRTELEETMGAPGFWDDQVAATRISTEHSRVTRKLERYERLQHEYEDSRELLELGEDEGEIAQLVAQLEKELQRLEEDAVFTGEYDAGDALLEIHAGTGGTDAQDWAEMLLRMYQRWATDRGFQWDMIERARARRRASSPRR